ncbi:hypothetical protein AMTRI_Chr08g160850 [Amborella trichopoda]
MGESGAVPHVLIFPFPAQGHINSMLKLAELFVSLTNFHVTFLNSEHNHKRLGLRADSLLERVHFEAITDGLPECHPRSADRIMDLFDSLKARTKPIFREMLREKAKRGEPPVTCVIGDAILSFILEIGEEVGVPVIAFRTVSACSLWAYFSIPWLIDARVLPIPEGADMDQTVTCVPGMEGLLRLRDLPSFCRERDISNPGLQLVQNETRHTVKARTLILNTFEALEGQTLNQIRKHCKTVRAIGPLHALLRAQGPKAPPLFPSMSLWLEDRSCLTWLDSQAPGSVLYVSFGSYTVISRRQLTEFCYGIVNSGKPFLWVIRPDLLDGEEAVLPEELALQAEAQGRFVKWAPQEEVLHHPAVVGFLTHSGWNSTLESLEAGVPMLCWSFFADQQVNSRFVEGVWGVGLDMKDVCDRVVVEHKVRELVGNEGPRRAARAMAERVRESVNPGGSSFMEFEELIDDIRSMRACTL